tara:strand:+ start:1084 stop:1398 length:315 start_codon:yes stop_codon:yes gene_type:complete
MTIKNCEIETSWMMTARVLAKFLKDDAPEDVRSELLRMAAAATSNAVVDDAAEAYRLERAEARAAGDMDFPTYSEWSENGSDPHAERRRAEARMNEDDDYRDLY